MNRFFKGSLGGLAVTLILLVSACSQKPAPVVSPTVAVKHHAKSLLDNIRAQGAQVIQQGARLQIILPTDRFFHLQTIEIKDSQKQTLAWIARYLHAYQQQFYNAQTIRVSAYTDTVFEKAKRDKLSNQYAQVVAAYLWNQGFSHQQLRVQGLGARQPIANPKTSTGSGDNRRVVIEVN